MTVREFINGVVVRLAGVYSAREAKAMSARLLQHYCGFNSYEHLVEPEREIEGEQVIQLESAVKQLESARPLQYVIGWQEFCGLKIKVQEGVLIPRPETEELVMWAEELLRERGFDKTGILDAACGSGAIAAAMAKRFPQAAVFACDLFSKALEISAKNFEINNCDNVMAFECDLLSEDALRKICDNISVGGCMLLNMIISNPPYVTYRERSQMHLNVLAYEPAEALFVPDEDPLLFYKALQGLASRILAPGGLILMEINEQFSEETAGLFNEPYFYDVEIRNDINDKPRMIKAVRSNELFNCI